MKIAITGATGLIGVHVVARLIAQGHSVRALVRDSAKLAAALRPLGVDAASIEQIRGDITAAADVEELVRGCDAVIHAAGLFSDAQRDAEKMQRINVQGTGCVLRIAAQHCPGPIVYLSSYLALFPPRGPLLGADDPVGSPRSLYASTKAEAERIARRWQQQGAHLCIVYPGAVHGPHDPTFGIGPQMIARYVREGVLVTEGGLVYTDVRDLAAVCVAALRSNEPHRYMFGGFFLEHSQLLQLLRDLTGRPLPAQRIPGWALRLLGRIGDALAPLRSTPPQLTFEAATVLTRTVPSDDQPTIAALGIEPIAARDSFRDLLLWMRQAGHLTAADIGTLAESGN
jgi:dihydroflavonol-4-reductase